MATSVFHQIVKKVWIFIISPRRNEHYRNYVIFKQALNDIKQSKQRLNSHSLSHVHLSHPRCCDSNATTHAFSFILRRAHSNAPLHNNIGEGFTNYVLYIYFCHAYDMIFSQDPNIHYLIHIFWNYPIYFTKCCSQSYIRWWHQISQILSNNLLMATSSQAGDNKPL
jgi:hypothetical protein